MSKILTGNGMARQLGCLESIGEQYRLACWHLEQDGLVEHRASECCWGWSRRHPNHRNLQRGRGNYVREAIDGVNA